jgi:hypothetical protein
MWVLVYLKKITHVFATSALQVGPPARIGVNSCLVFFLAKKLNFFWMNFCPEIEKWYHLAQKLVVLY